MTSLIQGAQTPMVSTQAKKNVDASWSNPVVSKLNNEKWLSISRVLITGRKGPVTTTYIHTYIVYCVLILSIKICMYLASYIVKPRFPHSISPTVYVYRGEHDYIPWGTVPHGI